jgi:hypothetical protein
MRSEVSIQGTSVVFVRAGGIGDCRWTVTRKEAGDHIEEWGMRVAHREVVTAWFYSQRVCSRALLTVRAVG